MLYCGMYLSSYNKFLDVFYAKQWWLLLAIWTFA